MSQQIADNIAEQYSANVLILSQQNEKRLAPRVWDKEVKNAGTVYVERFGRVEVVPILSRHADTPVSETPSDRRAMDMQEYAVADFLDSQDELGTLVDPKSPMAIAVSYTHLTLPTNREV